MREKDLTVSLLYDFYASLLSEKKREVFEMYYWEDLSLAEISEHTGTSRQGVRELIVRTGDELREYEKALRLYEKEKILLNIAERIEKDYPEDAQAIRETLAEKGE
jgi:predicted DNA-binding protein YlxM (UPF0122 family)